MEFTVNFTLPQIMEGAGNLPVQSFNNYPVLQRIGSKEVQVRQDNNIVILNSSWVETIYRHDSKDSFGVFW